MKNTFALVMAGMALAVSVQAMPTKQELDNVAGLVQELMAPEQEALKSGAKTRSDVAAAAVALATDKADTEAAKLLLLKGAFALYVRDGAFDKATETLMLARRTVHDLEPQYQANMLETALRAVPKKNGGQLYRLLDEMKTYISYQKGLAKLRLALARKPKDKELQLRLGEHYAVLGDWAKALAAFALSSNAKVAETALGEKTGKMPPKVLADFWWAYPGDRSDFEKPFRLHAVELYKAALASGKLSGLGKIQVERRIDETADYGVPVYEVTAKPMAPSPAKKDGLYCVVDLSGGSTAARYPVSYLDDVPKGGWTDEYKTSKLVLRKIQPGTFVMGDQVHGNEKFPTAKITLTKPFYIGVFEVTQRQWELVDGKRRGFWRHEASFEKRPISGVSYNRIRGEREGAKWPASSAVDEESFCGKLRTKTGLEFDLPTCAQWEYACRAGTDTDYNNGTNFRDAEKDAEMDKLGRYVENSWNPRWKKVERKNLAAFERHRDCPAEEGGTTFVGSYRPNAWSLYDMHGNVAEWCLDWFSWPLPYLENGVDPVGAASGIDRYFCGGAFCWGARGCSSYSRGWYRPSCDGPDYGFRLAIQTPAAAK